MYGAFRLQPTAGRLDRVIHRPRLVRSLRDRFERRLTLIVAPAGAGKSTALALAVESNRIDPDGIDFWLGAESGDNDRHQLLDGLGRSLGVTSGPETEVTLEVIVEEVWRQAPNDVVLIIDDVHLITSEESIGLLRDLVSKLPANGHLLLLGRTLPEIPTARLQAHGELLIVGAADLALDDAEVEDLLASRPTSIDRGDLPRHAALADLRLVAGPDAQVGFLEDEVLGALDPERLRVLARVSVLPDFDDPMALALSDGCFTAEALVADLPLIEDSANGHFRLHSLLRSVVQERVSSEEAREVVLLAAAIEQDRGNHPIAVELLAQGGDVDGVIEVARHLVAQPLLQRSYSELLVVRRILLRHQPASAITELLEAEYQEAQIERNAKPTEVIEHLLRIADQAQSEMDPIIEAVALFRAIHRLRSDGLKVPVQLTSRLSELGDTDRVAHSLMRFVACAEATRRGRVAEALQWLEDDNSVDTVLESVYRSVKLCELGRPEEVAASLGPGDLDALPQGSEIMISFAMWLRGDASPEVALAIVAEMTIKTLARRVVENSVSLLGVGTFIALAAGDVSIANRYLVKGEGIALPSGTMRTRQFMALGRAAVAAVHDSDGAGAEILGESLDQFPLGRWPSRHHLLCLSFIYVARPETRSVLDQCDLGRSLLISVRAGQAIVALREDGSAERAEALPWTESNLLRVQVLPHHLCELAIGASLAGNSDAEVLLQQLPNLPHLLERVVSESSSATATWPAGRSVRDEAERRLSRFPPRPTSQIRIAVLGEIQLWRNGELVEDDDWVRRRRVRELLAFLVEHGSVPRTVVAVALWPDLQERKALANLRVNLAYLQRVLEPDRPTGSATFHIQVDGDRVFLHPDTEVDATDFERIMIEALGHDRAGAPGPALDLYLSSLELYQGPFLSDFDAEWCEDNQVRFDSLALGGYCRVGELSAARGEPEQGLQWATRALGVSEFSERAGRLFSNCLLAMQDRPAAHQSLVSLLKRLGEAGLAPEPETEHLLARLRG